MVILVPHQGSNLHSLHWRHGVLKIGPLGKSLNLFFMARMGEQSVPLLRSKLLLVISSPLSCLFHTSHLALSDP